MGAAIVGGLIAAQWTPAEICVVEVDAAKRADLVARFGVEVSDAVVAADGAVAAVKPADAATVCSQLAAVGTARILSIAAGITVAALQAAAGPHAHVIRAMPNTPALVGEGVTAICGSEACTESDFAWAEEVLGAVGVVVRVEEHHMDAVTAVAGSGPGYLFLLAETLRDAAIAEGLPVDIADTLVRQLFRGAGILLASSPELPATLRERVTSPNGTTAAGLAEFDRAGLRETVNKVVRAAAARSQEMGR